MPLSKNGRSKNGDVLCTRVILYEFNQLGNKKILNVSKEKTELKQLLDSCYHEVPDPVPSPVPRRD